MTGTRGEAVSVVVPVRNGARSLPRLLDALTAQDHDGEHDVTVVDNGSSDGTADVARAHPSRPRVVVEPRPGSYRARNAGVAASSHPLVAFVDADCEPLPGWLRAGAAALADADLAGGAVEQVRRDAASVWERYDRALYLDQRQYVEVQGFAATANLFARRVVLEDLGGFDGELVSSGDKELCLRARARGYRLVYAADAVVRHEPRTTAGATWALHRRLGAGWAGLHRRGLAPPLWQEPALRLPLLDVVLRVAADGPPLRRRQLAPVHLLAMTARAVGRATGRP